MSAEPSIAAGAFARAVQVAELLAVDWTGLGGVHLVARAGPVRDAWLAALRARLPESVPFARIPANVTPDRLLGGLALAATLREGTPVFERGLLAALDGGVAVLAMAERLPTATVAHLTAALDGGEVAIERDGFATRLAARLGIVALDEGIGPDEHLAPSLADRLAFILPLDDIDHRSAIAPPPETGRLVAARRALPGVTVDDGFAAVLTEVAHDLGIASLRPPLHALRVCRVLAALDGRDAVIEDDVIEATGLVLLPRATQLPAEADPADAEEGDAEEPPPPPPQDGENAAAGEGSTATTADAERLVEAALANLPPDVLERLAGRRSRAPASAQRGRGAAHASRLRGRPTGVRAGRPGRGARLSLIDTMKTAAPWQPVRRRARPGGADSQSLIVLPDDFRVRTFKDRRENVTIFLVDASGSMAMSRLAEAKGAIELMLAQSYSRRDYVALVAFRGTAAELLLPPTRSLTRARRLLGALPGGGGTPLAAGLDAVRVLCEEVARKGRTPTVVILSDGRANVARDGTGGRQSAREEALVAARNLKALAVGTLFIDTARRPGAEGQAVAEAASARYLWLPAVEARAILAATQSSAAAATR